MVDGPIAPNAALNFRVGRMQDPNGIEVGPDASPERLRQNGDRCSANTVTGTVIKGRTADSAFANANVGTWWIGQRHTLVVIRSKDFNDVTRSQCQGTTLAAK